MVRASAAHWPRDTASGVEFDDFGISLQQFGRPPQDLRMAHHQRLHRRMNLGPGPGGDDHLGADAGGVAHRDRQAGFGVCGHAGEQGRGVSSNRSNRYAEIDSNPPAPSRPIARAQSGNVADR